MRNIGINRDPTPMIINKNQPIIPICACKDKKCIEFSEKILAVKFHIKKRPNKVVVNNHSIAVNANIAYTFRVLLSAMLNQILAK